MRKDAEFRRRHNTASRIGMQKIRERRAWMLQKKRGGVAGMTGYTVISGAELTAPSLRYIDANGCVHIEEELSAEQLIREWEKAQKKERKRK
jgi:hypothetical protein